MESQNERLIKLGGKMIVLMAMASGIAVAFMAAVSALGTVLTFHLEGSPFQFGWYGFCCIGIVTQMIAGAVHLMGSKNGNCLFAI